MRRIKNIFLLIIGLVLGNLLFTGCEFDEPLPTPSADFSVWWTNPETNAFEQIAEPLTLYLGYSYTFIVDGSGQQFVFWFGTPGDPESKTPNGTDFDDRGQNHLSKGKVVVSNNRVLFTYDTEGSYEVVLVASSYSYSEDKYVESLTKKTVQVVTRTGK